jgi:hypothetical protein
MVALAVEALAVSALDPAQAAVAELGAIRAVAFEEPLASGLVLDLAPAMLLAAQVAGLHVSVVAELLAANAVLRDSENPIPLRMVWSESALLDHSGRRLYGRLHGGTQFKRAGTRKRCEAAARGDDVTHAAISPNP